MKKMIDWVTIKFLLVGVVNTLVGSAVMFLLYNGFHTGYWIASACNYIVGSIVSYFLNKHFTFQSHGNSMREVMTFIINIVICYVVAYGIAKPCVYQLFGGYGKKVQDNLAMFAGMCLFVGLNYFGQRFIVFKDGKH